MTPKQPLMWWRWLTFVVSTLAVLASARAENRLALVIGDDAYEHIAPLQKAKVDAAGYAEVLRAEGYKVSEGYDLTFIQLNAAISGFVSSIQPGDTAVFVYSGHGWSDGSQNYLVSIDAPASASEDELAGVTTPIRNGVTGVLDRLERTGAQLRVAIVDACRDNPFRPLGGQRGYSFARGLAPMPPPPQGTFVVFSASAGESALDRLSEADDNPHSVFTRVFLPLLHSDISLQEAIKASQTKVVALARLANHVQKPAYWDEVVGPACLSTKCKTPSEVAPEKADEAMLAIEAWDFPDALKSLLPRLSEDSLKARVRARIDSLRAGNETGQAPIPGLASKQPQSVDELGAIPPASHSAEAQTPPAAPAAGRAAMLIAPADNPDKPVVSLGSTVWSLIPPVPFRPATVALRADADIADLKMHATMTLSKNTDPTLQATHLIDLRFFFADGARITGFKDVGLPQMRKEDSTAAETLTSVKVKISDVDFLIALAKDDQDTHRNLDLMQTRAWFDFPLLLNDDRVAKIVFQKSADGEAMLNKALDAWGSDTPASALEQDGKAQPPLNQSLPDANTQAKPSAVKAEAKPSQPPAPKPPDNAPVGAPVPMAPVGAPLPVIETLPQYKFARAVRDSPIATGNADSRYFTIVYGMIRSHLREPSGSGAPVPNKQGAVIFGVDESGNLIGRKMVTSSGSPNLDMAVMAAIAEAAPFPAPPNWQPRTMRLTYGR